MRDEIRVGNIVGYDLPMFKGLPFVIHSLYDTGVVLRKIKHEKNERMINCHNLAMLPISISILRLRKFHFMQIGSQFVMNGCWITPNEDNRFHVKIGLYEQTITAVHKLQNIFFKETGLELALPEF
ncbi:MAG: hypothetical protein PSX81_14940 [bacterium]|nr:hypothetical protein [bacterium]